MDMEQKSLFFLQLSLAILPFQKMLEEACKILVGGFGVYGEPEQLLLFLGILSIQSATTLNNLAMMEQTTIEFLCGTTWRHITLRTSIRP